MPFGKCRRFNKVQNYAANRFRGELLHESAHCGILKYFNKELQKSGS